MFDKTVSIFKKKDYIVPPILFENFRDFEISNEEFIFLIYIINHSDMQFNPKVIADVIKVDMSDVMGYLDSLIKKGFLSLENRTVNNRLEEYVSFDGLYKRMAMSFVNDESKEIDVTIYSLFESEFGRALSPMEFEIINGWTGNGYSNEIIEEALKEAIFNGVTSLRYIDKILFEWNKKGFKSKKDILNSKGSYKKDKKEKKELFSYDWLSDD